MYVFGAVDEFSKYVILNAAKTTNTRPVTLMLDELTEYFGLPVRIVNDRGTTYNVARLC